MHAKFSWTEQSKEAVLVKPRLFKYLQFLVNVYIKKTQTQVYRQIIIKQNQT